MPETQTPMPDAAELEAKLKHGLALHQQGKLADAERIYQEILQAEPTHFHALHFLGVIAAQTQRTAQAVDLISKAIELNPNVAIAHSNFGNALKELKRPAEALASYDKAIAIKSDFAEAYNNRGSALLDLKRPEEALASYDHTIALKPYDAIAYSNRGNALLDLGRPDEALASYDKAIALKPDYAEAYSNRGNALLELKYHAEALVSNHKALALNPGYAEAYCNRGEILRDLKRPQEALACYEKAIALRPDYAAAYGNRGNALKELKRPIEALASYDKAIALKPDFAEAFCNRGNILRELKRDAEALVSYDKAVGLRPDLAQTYSNRGDALRELEHYAEALMDYDRAIELKPDLAGLRAKRLHAKLQTCEWSIFDTECASLISSVRDRNINVQPFVFLAIPSSPDDQFQCAKSWVANTYPASDAPIWQGEIYNHTRIRVAYLSADFHQHATSWLMAGMFESHDKSRFDVTAISFGTDDKSEMRQRLEASIEHFIDAKTHSDDQISDLVRSLEIDLLVDLKGFTADSRTSILARRAAPIQVNYLGYPGTMGAPYIDYIIADKIVIPEIHRRFYSEKVVYLPNSYQANDAKRHIADRVFTRTELGLPAAGFVFCCFNNNYKITPSTFSCWMRILEQVEGSVLWLFEGNAKVESNLRKEAVVRGVNAERLIFAKRMSPSEHLARGVVRLHRTVHLRRFFRLVVMLYAKERLLILLHERRQTRDVAEPKEIAIAEQRPTAIARQCRR